MDRIERISGMEEKLVSSLGAVRALDAKLDTYCSVRESIRELEDYLSSRKWLEDFEADELGLLPADLKRGVLSEDGITELLDAHDELLKKLDALREQTRN